MNSFSYYWFIFSICWSLSSFKADLANVGLPFLFLVTPSTTGSSSLATYSEEICCCKEDVVFNPFKKNSNRSILSKLYWILILPLTILFYFNTLVSQSILIFSYSWFKEVKSKMINFL